MYSKIETCTVCRTTMRLFDTQPVDDRYEVVFFRCPLCAKSQQVAAAYANLMPAGTDDSQAAAFG
jgi:hypothetical protein